jgi:hypothetical protein
MITFLWWLAVVLALYFGVGIGIGFVKRLKVPQYAIITFIVSLVYCLTMM